MDLRKVKLIDAALERLDRGEFGLCADCEESIPAKRLEVHALGSLLRAMPGSHGLPRGCGDEQTIEDDCVTGPRTPAPQQEDCGACQRRNHTGLSSCVCS